MQKYHSFRILNMKKEEGEPNKNQKTDTFFWYFASILVL